MSSITGIQLQAKAADQFLSSKHSPLAGTGRDLVLIANQKGVDWRLLVAIAGAETSFGTTGNATSIHNPFGMGPGLRYPSWQAAYGAAADNLKKNYIGQGRTSVMAIQQKWAPSGATNDPTGLNNNWTTNVSTYLRALGGDPNNVTKRVSDPSGLGAITTIPGDAVGAAKDAASAVSNPLSQLVDLFKFILDPKLWLRIGEMIVGVIAIVAGGAVLFKVQGVAGKPLGLLIAGFGFLWLYSGIRGINPIEGVKSVVGA